MTLMPCFGPYQAHAEGILIGQLLAGYGEIELTMCECIIAIKGTFDPPIRDIFNERRAETRIKNAKKCLICEYTKAHLQIELVEALDDIDWCRHIRNQYAHCHWYWTQQEGLCFVNLEELAKQPTTIANLMDNRHSIDVLLLGKQEEYFNYVKESFTHLARAYRAWNLAQKAPQQSTQVFAKPSKIARPLSHN